MDEISAGLDELSAADRLIVALDFPSAAAALALVDRLEGRTRWFKVGLELYLAAGADIVSTLRERGFQVFLDLKLHDIPNTVAGAIRSITSQGASLTTVHAAGGPAMLQAAVEAAARSSHAPRLLAVTLLTSTSPAGLLATGVPDSPATQVLRLARLAAAAGITGLVAASEEVRELRTTLPNSLLVVPGIRPAGAARNDQSRVATPGAAIEAGASMLVVGRPVTEAPNPAAAVAAILREMSEALR